MRRLLTCMLKETTSGPTLRSQIIFRSWYHSSADLMSFVVKSVPMITSVMIAEELIMHQGWQSSESDAYFEAQRHQADHCDDKTAWMFYDMMKEIAKDMHHTTGGLHIEHLPHDDARILDCCMAPGGFLSVCLEINPGHRAVAFTLPVDEGGHRVLLPLDDGRVKTNFLDITMLSGDVGVTKIPFNHPDAVNFLPQQLPPEKTFDIVLCDGQVLRTHQRASYRERREARRLTLSQIILGLEHIDPGGTMIILLHKLETFNTANLLHKFSKFASLKVYKSVKYHAKRSSFYLIATNIQPYHVEALSVVSAWKKLWITATLGTDMEYERQLREEELGVYSLLNEYGPELMRLGQEIWCTQANALARMTWVHRR
ncbi:hypothetical protein KVT40_001863 [Elsinoe batatas]|uniref:Ribosomal RNA methyltransferase FtsJ domain-containing protein n=1 Tax=Elsinoe batatas TaxID=2601811 RepID=A0A8K0L5T4_9PEZI|nr:hypothetical protein KVT40_001863 [Elsinoe batatas]